MSKPQDLLYDKRLLNRHVRRGLITAEQRQAHLDGLEDLTEIAAPLVAEYADVGVKHVKSERDVELAD